MASRRKRAEAAATAAPAPGAPSRARLAAHLAAAVLVLVVLQWHRAATVRSQAGGRFEDFDAAFHAWRASRAIAAHAWLPLPADPFDSFPSAGRSLWPPLHDASLALLARLGGSSAADPGAGLPLAGAFPVLESAGLLLLAAWVALRLSGARAAVFTAWALALTPSLIRRGAYGEIDHNVTELLCAAGLAALATAQMGGRPRTWQAALLWGALLLLTLGFYTGSLAAAGLLGLGLLASDRERAGEAAAGFALAALALPLFASLRLAADPADPWRLGPSFALGLAAGAMALGGGTLLLARRLDSLPCRLAAAGLLTGALLWILAPGPARLAFFDATSFLGSHDPWLATIDEFRPLFSGVGFDPLTELARGCPPLLLLAAALALAPRAFVRTRLLAVPAIGFLLLALSQQRYLPAATLFSALAGAVALAGLDGTRRSAAPVALAAGGLVALPFLGPFLSLTLSGRDASQPHPAESAAAMLVRTTPAPGDPPAWGVLAPWDWGHLVLLGSARPMAVNNFGSMQPDFARKLRIYLDPSPVHALAELRTLRVRYLITAVPRLLVPSTAAAIGDAPGRFFDGVDPKTFVAGGALRRPGALTLAVRLHEAIPPAREADRDALAHFRPVAASPETVPGMNGPVAAIRLWEVLP